MVIAVNAKLQALLDGIHCSDPIKHVGRPNAGARPIIGSSYLLAIYLSVPGEILGNLVIPRLTIIIKEFHPDQPVICQKSMRNK